LLLVCYLFASASCGTPKNNFSNSKDPIITGAERSDFYLPLLKDKKVGIVTNQTGIIKISNEGTVSIVDYLISNKIAVQKIFAPEHGFRGTADYFPLRK
jgi:uncharacterized protein YbbC (DUF1343 family)